MTLGGDELEGTTHLKPGTDDLKFRFTAFHDQSPEKIRFSYRLHGFDSEWTPIGHERVVSFAALPAGDQLLDGP